MLGEGFGSGVAIRRCYMGRLREELSWGVLFEGLGVMWDWSFD